MDKEDLNYCRCGEYLTPKQQKCDSPDWGCGRPRPGLYCTRAWLHTWVEPGRYTSSSDHPVYCSSCSRERWDLFWWRIDWKKRGKAYWKSVFRHAVQSTYSTGYTRFDPVKEILERRYQERLPKPQRGDDPVRDYGREVGGWLKQQLRAMEAGIDDSCIDNTRFAEITNRKDVKRYRKAQASGCCGRHDTKVTYGIFRRRTFLIGCNYGH